MPYGAATRCGEATLSGAAMRCGEAMPSGAATPSPASNKKRVAQIKYAEWSSAGVPPSGHSVCKNRFLLHGPAAAKRGLQIRRLKSERPRLALECHLAVAVDQVDAIWPCRVRALGGIAEFIEHRGNLDAQLAHAGSGTCVRKLGIEIPAVLDEFGNSTESAYTAWPDRIYLIDRNGKVAFKSKPGPFGFKPADLQAALRSSGAVQ